ncbi:hypothetical protein ACFT5B_07025 [Luteimicrobium sp. NPDC057192]|uniref:hypothetical protein n=1 Tax=Luteimicrobium sp. NPDC057192 TaxID=3346042 RepID=UPI003624AECE
MNLSDIVTARLRTLVPVWWGLAVAWVLAQWPAVKDLLDSWGVDLNSTAVQLGVVGVVIAAWDYVWKRLEDHLPAWLTRLVIGSNQTPTYAPVDGAGVATITTLPADHLDVAPDVALDAEAPAPADDTTDEPTDGAAG